MIYLLRVQCIVCAPERALHSGRRVMPGSAATRKGVRVRLGTRDVHMSALLVDMSDMHFGGNPIALQSECRAKWTDRRGSVGGQRGYLVLSSTFLDYLHSTWH